MNELVGTVAPNFKLKDKDNKEYHLKDLNNDFIVIYFYPKDNTPGCTIEAQMFNKDLSKFKELNTLVLGISGGDNKSKENFCNKFGLEIPLLSDEDYSVSKKYNVFGKKKIFGKEIKGISRITFILDKHKKIIKIFDKVKPKDHSLEVLEFIKSIK